jgi:oligopeptidase B
MGRQWYEDGKLQHKRNTFTDFVAVARHLVDAGVTHRAPGRRGRLGGRPADGRRREPRPELFAGILADVPFVDALTTILDPRCR